VRAACEWLFRHDSRYFFALSAIKFHFSTCSGTFFFDKLFPTRTAGVELHARKQTKESNSGGMEAALQSFSILLWRAEWFLHAAWYEPASSSRTKGNAAFVDAGKYYNQIETAAAHCCLTASIA
jgi:hypothetical protein